MVRAWSERATESQVVFEPYVKDHTDFTLKGATVNKKHKFYTAFQDQQGHPVCSKKGHGKGAECN